MEHELIRIFKALSDESRLRIYNLLFNKNLCVCEVEQIVKLQQSNTSRHLSRLKEASLIFYKKEGQFVRYHINHDLLEKYTFLKQMLEEIKNDPLFVNDIKTLESASFC